jgi:hypothetical protein
MIVGYSSTPLARKLGIKPGTVLWAMRQPAEYRTWLSPLPAEVSLVAEPPKGGCDIVHLFVPRLADLDRDLRVARRAMKVDGALWLSWYKKSARVPTDVTEGLLRERALATDLVDVKVCAVTELWSGLKLVVRRHLRPQASRSAR